MPRISSTSTHSLLEQTPDEAAQAARPSSADLVWEARFLLASATPVLGGGVEPFEPDPDDPVRLASIRGHLRAWTRALQGAEPRGKKDFEKEIALWGGVREQAEVDRSRSDAAVPSLTGAVRSRVRLSVRVIEKGRIAAAGVHTANPGQPPKAFPQWSGHRSLGYALFPLQRSNEERYAAPAGESIATRPWREKLAFELVVRVIPARGAKKRAQEDDVEAVLRAIWAWIYFGGLGARTRRGFGALMLSATPDLGDLARFGFDAAQWTGFFWPASVREFQSAARAILKAGWRFQGASLLIDPRPLPIQSAHAAILDHLRTFRQGLGDGRARNGNREGRSFWPEADLLRLERERHAPKPSYEHPPTSEHRGVWTALESGAPRAAFGLPIEVNFKDGGDKAAAASLLPALPEGSGYAERHPERLASPLIVRPLVLQGRVQDAYPMALAMAPVKLGHVRIRYSDKALRKQKPEDQARATITRAGGADHPVSQRLKSANGDALQAFTSWIQQHQGYGRVNLGGKP